MAAWQQFSTVWLALIVATTIVSGMSNCPDETVGLSCTNLNDRSEWGVCTVRGDPHIHTLDGKEWRYFGQCEYILSEFCEDNGNDFQITADFDPRVKDPSQTYAASVTLKIDGESFTIGVSGASPATGTYTTAENGYTVYVFANAANTKLYIRVTLNGEDIVRICYRAKFHLIEIHFDYGTHYDQVCGLCGFWDGKESNDLKTKSNKPRTKNGNADGRRKRRGLPHDKTQQKFGIAWKLNEDCVEPDIPQNP
ncbi:BMP-binding endothelial regulator protein-like [Apostichopus japonicus]|uniref:BMP-binding endothelial regulator protein-like n=1 Tax=Stichopus japonicus TaxID=307972 RepID=UPI003AB7BEF3